MSRRIVPRAAALMKIKGAIVFVMGLTMTTSAAELPLKDGYRGIWHGQPSDWPGVYKYSGGLGTYPQQMNPLALYDEASNRTYFVFGARARDPRAGMPISDGNTLQIHIGYFDHATGMVGRPRLLMSKASAGTNPHENATIAMDDDGYLYVFVNTHGPAYNGDGSPARADSFLFKSTAARSVNAFDEILGNRRSIYEQDTLDPLTGGVDDRTRGTNFAYSQSYNVPGQGILFLHTRYRDGWAGRDLKFSATTDGGATWAAPQTLAAAGQGHYSVSTLYDQTVGIAFNYHPNEDNFESKRGLDARTNLYYVRTADLGRTWQTASGAAFTPGATSLAQLEPALVHDYASEDKLVFLKDIQYIADGHPVLLYLTSTSANPTNADATREWNTARYDGSEWVIRPVTKSDHNYDFGSLYIEPDGVWRLIAPTDDGPIPGGTGGAMRMLVSEDQGASWRLLRELADGVGTSHSYARRPLNAHDDFYAFWADGDPFHVSESALYFTDRQGTGVWRLPYRGITAELTAPELVWTPEPAVGLVCGAGVALASRRSLRRRPARV